MTTLAIQVYDVPKGNLLYDWTYKTEELTFGTNEHGYSSLTAQVPLTLVDSFQLYDKSGLLHVEINDNTMDTVWEGRLEDIAITDTGITLSALGYWRSLYDAPYTALWSETDISQWEITTDSVITFHSRTKYEYEMTGTVIKIMPRKNEQFGSGINLYGGSVLFRSPYASNRSILRVEFDYTLVAPVNWTAALEQRGDDPNTYIGAAWTLNGNGATQSGSSVITTSSATICFTLYYNGTITIATETGAIYLKISNIRIKTINSSTVYADDIAKALITYITGINSTQLSTNTSLVQSPTLDLKDEVYEDVLPADILTKLVALGDNQTPPRKWEVGIYENRVLFYRPRGSAGRAWYVDATSLEVQKSLENMINSVYAVYKSTDGSTQRGSSNTDSSSVTRYGVTRRRSTQADTTSSTVANVQRDTILNDTKTINPQASIEFDKVYSITGALYPSYLVRSGDTVTIRNLPPTLSTAIDKIRTFRISATEYNAKTNKLTLTPELPLSTIDVLLARKAESL
jgi:hypothetical protein